MGKRKKAQKDGKQASAQCIAVMIDRLGEAASIASAALTLMKKGQPERAFHIALDIEPLIHEADRLLQAASALRRSGTRPSSL